MAKAKIYKFLGSTKRKRKGIHSKNKSRTKGGKQYVKRYKGQGK